MMSKNRRDVQQNTGEVASASPLPDGQKAGAPSAVDPRKLDLEIRKLQFEVTTGKRLELFKAVAPLVTSLGILGTLFVGLWQMRQTQVSRDDDRFERSVTRLGSTQANERLTGLAGIQQFLKSPDPARQESTLRYFQRTGN